MPRKSPPGSLSPAYWRARAEQARTLALVALDNAAVARMHDCAADYDKMADILARDIDLFAAAPPSA